MKKFLPLLLIALAASASSAGAATIIFEDQFNTNLSWTTVGNTVLRATEGDYAGSPINTSGSSDHSAVHFDADGNEIAATGVGLRVIGGGQTPPVNSISRTLSLTAGVTYNIYFRYAGSHNGLQRATGTLTLGAESSTTGILVAPNAAWATGSFSFTPTTSGNATLTFDDTGSNTTNSDLLIDSVVVAAIPEPGIAGLFGMTGLLVLLRRRRHA